MLGQNAERGRSVQRTEERSEKMLYYGESDYWVAHYRTLTEGSSQQQTHSAEDCRRGPIARATALVAAMFSRIARRGVKKEAGLGGRAQRYSRVEE